MLFLIQIKNFVVTHWKKLCLLVLLLLPLATYSGGYYQGKHSLPTKIEQTVKQVEDKKIDIVATQKTDATVRTQQTTQEATKTSAATDVTKTKTTITKKDGTVIVKETEHEHIGTKTETKAATETKINSDTKTEASTTTHVEDHIVTQIQTKIEYSNPTWNLSLVLATTPADLFSTSPIKVGAFIQHRLFSNFFVGGLVLVPPSDLKQTQVGISIGLLTQ